MNQPEIILASASPRRRKLLGSLGLQFQVLPAGIDEQPLPAESPGAMVSRLAREKAQHIAKSYPTALIIAADTTVAFQGQALGKPSDAAEASAMLESLRGQVHEVITGVFILWAASDYQYEAQLATAVYMRNYDDVALTAYVASGDPLDKAGGYAIQHNEFQPVDHIEGCYSNVVGLPLCVVYQALSGAAVAVNLCALRVCNAYHNSCPTATLLLETANCA